MRVNAGITLKLAKNGCISLFELSAPHAHPTEPLTHSLDDS